MTKRNIKTRAGFTIIEVVLVLAIAGLIFMMVFIALPALQRSQRDTQRNSDIGRLQSAFNNYQASNRNAIPTDGPTIVEGHEEKLRDTEAPSRGTWAYFYDNYLLVGSGGTTDTFADPDGDPYSLIVNNCKDDGKAASGEDCDNKVQRYNVTFDEQSTGTGDILAGTEVDHAISVVIGATCEGEAAVGSTGARKVAMIYKKEGGGVICLNN